MQFHAFQNDGVMIEAGGNPKTSLGQTCHGIILVSSKSKSLACKSP